MMEIVVYTVIGLKFNIMDLKFKDILCDYFGEYGIYGG
jgi:hypothetical protein